ncbi:unnamed protein product, partial [Iphiclides podalirius]
MSKPTNGILQSERAVRALCFAGTSVRITPAGDRGVSAGRGEGRASGSSPRPWERSAFNASHVLETLLTRAPRHGCERDGARRNKPRDKETRSE